MAGLVPTSKQLGSAIREQRERRGMTIEGLAGKADVHPTTLSGIEREGDNPTWDVIQPIVEALAIDLSTLAQRAEAIAKSERAQGTKPSSEVP